MLMLYIAIYSFVRLDISLVTCFNLTFDLGFPPLDDVSLIASGGM